VKIVFSEFYRDQRIFEYAEKLGIALLGLGDGAARPADHSKRPPVDSPPRPNAL
jgi:hypothetical protein